MTVSKTWTPFALAAPWIAGIAACTPVADRVPASSPLPHEPASITRTAAVAAAPAGASPAFGAAAAPHSLADVFALVRAAHPALAADRARADAAAAEIERAGLRANPEASVGIEDVAADDSGFDESETTLRMSQAIDLAGLRRARRDAAETALEIERVRGAAREREVLLGAKLDYLALLAARTDRGIAADRLALDRELALHVDERRRQRSRGRQGSPLRSRKRERAATEGAGRIRCLSRSGRGVAG